MLKRIFIKPASGLKVRKPFDGAHLSDSGETVVCDQYWRRRIIDGSVLESVKPTKTAAAKTKKPAPESLKTED
jgi:hypothetical protein